MGAGQMKELESKSETLPRSQQDERQGRDPGCLYVREWWLCVFKAATKQKRKEMAY